MNFERGQDPIKSLDIGLCQEYNKMIYEYIGYDDTTPEEALSGALRQALHEKKGIALVQYVFNLFPDVKVGSISKRSTYSESDNHIVEALYTRNLSIIKLIVGKSNASDLNVIMKYGNNVSALEWSIQESRWNKSHIKIFNLLLESGADPNYYHGGPLLQAITINNSHIVKKLLWKGANLSTKGGRIRRYIRMNSDWEKVDTSIMHAINLRESDRYPDGSNMF